MPDEYTSGALDRMIAAAEREVETWGAFAAVHREYLDNAQRRYDGAVASLEQWKASLSRFKAEREGLVGVRHDA